MDDDPDNPSPTKPEGLWLTMQWDVSTAVRPAEHLGQRAMRWTQAQADQVAYRDALEDVQQEAQGFARLANEPAAQVG